MISGSNEKELDIANQIADLLLEKEKLQQENKQLKEQLDVHKILLQTNAPSTCILTELEEWLKEHKNLYEGNEFQNNAKFCMTVDQVLDKIQELKEKYK